MCYEHVIRTSLFRETTLRHQRVVSCVTSASSVRQRAACMSSMRHKQCRHIVTRVAVRDGCGTSQVRHFVGASKTRQVYVSAPLSVINMSSGCHALLCHKCVICASTQHACHQCVMEPYCHNVTRVAMTAAARHQYVILSARDKYVSFTS